VHNQQIEVKLDFIKFDEDEEGQAEEEKKQQNAEINRENYKDHFPTLAQTNKVTHNAPAANDWPFLLGGGGAASGAKKPGTA
jgi:hypothetical protein